MSTSNVVRLGEYRDRRERRLRETVAHYSADPERSAVVEQLAGALTLLSADRAAVVWVDEYGPGLVHVHALIDLGSEPPSRRFSITPLKAAWEEGIPGLLDYPDYDRGLSLYSGRPRSQAVVSLGSDGARAWFVVVDSMTPRPALGDETTEFLMFFAGECAGVLLHKDLPEGQNGGRRGAERLRRERFAGWPVLRDIEGREDDDRANRRISCRFMVSRVVRRLIEDDFALDPDALKQQVQGVRREVKSGPSVSDGGNEAGLWERVLDSAAELDLAELASATLALANEVENQGHLYGARELHRCAYDVAVAAGSGKMVVDALRFHGRTCRKLGELDAAEYWYEKADAVAREVGDLGLVAKVLTGRANLKRQLGNFPEARELLAVQEEVAEASGDRNILAQCYHGWMSLESDAGEWQEAVVRGWRAFELYAEGTDRFIALSDLAWVLVDSGSLRSAEDAFTVVLERSGHALSEANALEGLVRVAALRADHDAMARWIARADDALSRAERSFEPVLAFDRAVSYLEVGMVSQAKDHFRAARDAAREFSLNRIYFQSTDRLEQLDEADGAAAESGRKKTPLEGSDDEKVAEVLQGLSDLRAEVVSVSR